MVHGKKMAPEAQDRPKTMAPVDSGGHIVSSDNVGSLLVAVSTAIVLLY